MIWLGGLPLGCSWVCCICASSVTWLYASRFASGIGSGMVWLALSMYLGEIADPRIRGSLITMNVNIASAGLFLGTVMGPYLSMETFAYVSLVPNILFLILFSFVPESPYHYTLHGDADNAEKSLRWFRRRTNVKEELLELREFVQDANVPLLSRLREYLRAENLKKTAIILGVYGFSYASGYSTLSSYAEIVLTRGGIEVTPSFVVMGLGFANVVAGVTATLVVDRFGRKWLLIVSCLGVTGALLMLGLHFHLLREGFEPRGLTWFPVTSMLLFNLFVSYGLIPIPGALLSEMFPATTKNLAGLLVSSANAAISFACARSYQPFVDLVGERFVFWTYSLLTLLAVPYIYFFIPETTGKSLLEIQHTGKR